MMKNKEITFEDIDKPLFIYWNKFIIAKSHRGDVTPALWQADVLCSRIKNEIIFGDFMQEEESKMDDGDGLVF